MNTQTEASQRIGGSSVRARVLASLFACAIAVLVLVGAANARAVTTGIYGEEHRFGGFDETGLVPGKFDLPVGFAVDPNDSSTSDKNAVYVLDRVVSNPETGELGYRLQKLTSSGSVLGVATLPVEHYTDTNEFSDAHPLISLTVDSARHRVYAVVESIVNEGKDYFVPVVQKVVAWSTIPNAEKHLVAAAGYPVDPTTGAGLVAGESVLMGATSSQDLYAPEALTVARNHDVVIVAQQGVSNGTVGGPAELARVATEGANSGKLDGTWVANSKVAPRGGIEQPTGLFTSSTGAYGIGLEQGEGKISRLAEVNENLEAEAKLIAPDTSGGVNLDEAPSIDTGITTNRREGEAGGNSDYADLSTVAPGTPITQLSNGLYAARFAQSSLSTDPQSEIEPWNGVPYFWVQERGEQNYTGNLGVRLFNSEGVLVQTIGGQPQGSACNIDYARFGVAAGAHGSVFVMTQPNKSNENSDDQVIEFTVGGKGACPAPSGTVTVNGKSGSSFSFPAGTSVTLQDAVERKGGVPYRFDWPVVSKSGVEDLYNQIEAPAYKWPAPSKTHVFNTKGTYYVTATIYGDYGVTSLSGVIEIKIT